MRWQCKQHIRTLDCCASIWAVYILDVNDFGVPMGGIVPGFHAWHGRKRIYFCVTLLRQRLHSSWNVHIFQQTKPLTKSFTGIYQAVGGGGGVYAVACFQKNLLLRFLSFRQSHMPFINSYHSKCTRVKWIIFNNRKWKRCFVLPHVNITKIKLLRWAPTNVMHNIWQRKRFWSMSMTLFSLHTWLIGFNVADFVV